MANSSKHKLSTEVAIADRSKSLETEISLSNERSRALSERLKKLLYKKLLACDYALALALHEKALGELRAAALAMAASKV